MYNMVLAFTAEVREPIAGRYTFEVHPDGANLSKRDGLPTSIFRTDDW